MPNALSQEEIDALLVGVQDGQDSTHAGSAGTEEPSPPSAETKKKDIKVYDFRHPDKFSRSHLSAIELINENLARQLGASLLIYLRQDIHIDVTSVEQTTFGEYSESLDKPTTFVVFSIAPLQGSAVLTMDPSLTFMIFDRLLGGSGDQLQKNRELTDIEKGIIGKMSNKMLETFRDAWLEVAEMKPEAQAIETNPDLLQVVPPTETVAVVTFEVKMKSKGSMSICVPYLSLEPVTSKLGRQIWFSDKSKSRKSTPGEREFLEESLQGVVLPVTIELGKTTIAIRDLLQLRINDAIQVDTPAGGAVSIKIQDYAKFYGKPGILGKKLAAKIV